MFCNCGITITVSLIWASPHPIAPIVEVHAKSGLVHKQDQGPVSWSPVHMVLTPLASFLSMPPNQGNSHSWSAGSETSIMQTVPYRLCRDCGTRCFPEVALQPLSHWKISSWLQTLSGIGLEQRLWSCVGALRDACSHDLSAGSVSTPLKSHFG